MIETDAKARVIPVCFYLGAVMFVTCFFLRAVRDATSNGSIYLGWECAAFTFHMFPHWFFLPFLVNPLAVVFFLARIFNRFPRLRLCIAIATLVLFVPTWLALGAVVVMLGCAMWVVSVLLMMSEDLGAWKLRLLISENP